MTPSSGLDAGGSATSRILIVEDDAAIRRLAEDLLLDEGYEVLTAASGPDGLETVAGERPDLVIVDLMMPHMDGASFASELGRLHQGVPLLVVSGAQDLQERAEEMGAAGAILKPFDIDDFAAVVREVLGAAGGGGDDTESAAGGS